jgi:hypothetical protein
MFDIREFGATGNGRDKDTAAMQRAVDACSENGGGVVYCPPGTYLCGSIVLKTSVELHLEAGATILGSPDRADYTAATGEEINVHLQGPPTPLLLARGAQHVAITGRGTIDGNGRAFFTTSVPLGRTHKAVPGWRPSHMLAFVECQDVLVRDVHLVDSPLFTVWPLGCDRVTIQGITVRDDREGPNADGIHLDCSSDVCISDCTLECGDDCIALTSNAWLLGYLKPCEKVTVSNCRLSTSCNAIRVGFAGEAPIRNVCFNNLVIYNTRTGINIAVPSWPGYHTYHGPSIENVSFSQVIMEVGSAFWLYAGHGASAPGCMRNVSFSDVLAMATRGSYIGGARELPIEGIRLRNMEFILSGQPDETLALLPEPLEDPWGLIHSGGIPHGLYFRHVRDLALHDVRVRWREVTGGWRSALRGEDIDGLDLDGVTCRQAPGADDHPAINLVRVTNGSVRGCRAWPGTGTFLRTEDSQVVCCNNDVSGALRAVDEVLSESRS